MHIVKGVFFRHSSQPYFELKENKTLPAEVGTIIQRKNRSADVKNNHLELKVNLLEKEDSITGVKSKVKVMKQ